MRIFVLIYNAGTDNEGIHSIREGERNKILMFESEDDATRFALMLEAQDFLSPTVEAMDAEEIKEFCESADYDWELIPANSNFVVTPPEINVEQTDWQANASQGDTDITSQPQEVTPAPGEFSDSELDNIRRKLEGLL